VRKKLEDRKKKGQLAAQATLAPTSPQQSRVLAGSALTNSNRKVAESQQMASDFSEPVTTLYIFTRNRCPVAWSLGLYPPDPGPLAYDALLRIPIATNGSPPAWRAFTWRHGESIQRAMTRARIDPLLNTAAAPAGNGHNRPRPKKSRRSRQTPATPDASRFPKGPLGGTPDVSRFTQPTLRTTHHTILGSSPDGRVFVLDRLTRQIAQFLQE
jgi:hypothetical protein